MRDSEVVAAIVAGDPAGLAYAYDRYAAPLYTYCRTLLREPADAADAVQDTFVLAASRVSALRDPDRLRSWLYAVARNECHRRLRGGSDQAPLEEAPDMTDESANVPLDAERAELRTLVNAAMGGVGPAEREVLELQLRQGLDGGEVAAVLGVSRNHAHALLSRARDQLHTALGVLLVARSGRQDCPELAGLLRDWDGHLSVLMRKRINRHIERCPVCADRRRRELAPAMFLGVAPLVALPALGFGLPHWLREHVLRATSGSLPAHHALALTRSGFPRPLNPPRVAWWHPARVTHNLPVSPRAAQVGAAAVSAAGIALAVTVVSSTPPRLAAPLTPGRPTPTSTTTTPAGAIATVPGTVSGTPGGTPASSAAASATSTATPSASASGSATPSSSASATPTPSSTPTTPPPPQGKLSATPTLIVLSPLLGNKITLTATGGRVNWTVSIPSGLLGNLNVSPSHGTIASGSSATVSLSEVGLLNLASQITFHPGNVKVTVILTLALPIF